MIDFAKRKCAPCKDGAKPLEPAEIRQRLINLKDWSLASDGKSLRRDLVMRDFAAALDLMNRVAALAESEGHHPDLHLTGLRLLGLELSTHKIGGLSDNDFILAAKIDELPKALKKA